MPVPVRHAPAVPLAAPVLGCVLALALAACRGPVDASGDVGTGPAEGGHVAVSMTDNEFTPSDVTVRAGREVTVEVTNDGGAVHNLVIDELAVSTGSVAVGDVAHATFTVPAGGVAFHCSFHPGMAGRLVTS